MSQSGGGVEAIRRSASPGSLKRKRDSPAFAHSHTSPREASKSAKLTNGASSLDPRLQSASSSSDAQPSKHYRSPDSDDMHQADSGDLLHGVGSASSLNSAASSVFSHNSQAFAQNRKGSLANGFTPLTSNTDSSPPKNSSPRHLKSSTDMASTNGASAASLVPAFDATPEPTLSRKQRPQMLPPPGTAKGYRVVWDPELDNKLSKEERKRATPRRREFGTEVRYIFEILLSLHNIIHIT